MQKSTEIPQAVIDDIQTISHRTPIVDDYDPSIHERAADEDWFAVGRRVEAHEASLTDQWNKTDRQWRVLTEAAKQTIINSPDARQVAATFTTLPLSETLPKYAVDTLAPIDSRTARIAGKLGKTLGRALSLEPVPAGLLRPDVANAPHLKRVEDTTSALAQAAAYGPEYYPKRLMEVRENVSRLPGITGAEKDLVHHRYKYARDVKMLGLLAELQDNPGTMIETSNGLLARELPSGTKLTMTQEAYELNRDLLNPLEWRERIQLKDRVYNVSVGGKPYIMKERKTRYHTDVKRGGHKDGLTSEEEFTTALEFASLGTISDGDVELHWEKPLGFVSFPDGYEFCLFQSEPNLQQSVLRPLSDTIRQSADAYQDEFATIKNRAAEILAERPDLVPKIEHPPRPARKRFSPFSRKQKQPNHTESPADELDFSQFAYLKSQYLHEQAKNLLQDTMHRQSYINSDFDGFAFRIKAADNERTKLEIIGFDFEYYQSQPERATEIHERVTQQRQSGEEIEWQVTKNYEQPILTAASYALLEQLGHRLPPKQPDQG